MTAVDGRPDEVGAQSDPPAPTLPQASRRTLRGDAALLARPLAVYAASRAVVLAAFAAVHTLRPEMSLARSLYSWDASWYVHLANTGYPNRVPAEASVSSQNTIAFFPMLPLLMRGLRSVTGWSHLTAGVVISVLGGAVAAVLLWLLVRHLADGDDAADRAVALFSFFPASFVLVQPYTEGLFLALAIGCLFALLRHKWLLAGVLSAVATATRPTAVVLVACCAVQALLAVKDRREWRALIAPALAPVGIAAYFGYLWVHTGDPLAWFKVLRRGWGQHTDFGVQTAQEAWYLVTQDPKIGQDALSSTLSLLFVLITVALMIRWRPPAVFFVYVAGIVFFTFSTEAVNSRVRYVYAAFPLLIALARKLRRPYFDGVLGASAVTLGLLTLISFATIPTLTHIP